MAPPGDGVTGRWRGVNEIGTGAIVCARARTCSRVLIEFCGPINIMTSMLATWNMLYMEWNIADLQVIHNAKKSAGVG